MKRASLLGTLLLALAGTGSAWAAELFTLSPENYEQSVPPGKEVDAFFGDYVLRNDRLVAVVADPQLVIGRSGSRKFKPMMHGIIDLAPRDGGRDLLVVFNPAFEPARPANNPGEPHRQADFVDEAQAHRLFGREPQMARRVTLAIPYNPPLREVRYILEDGWPCVRVEIEYLPPKEGAISPVAFSLDLGPAPARGQTDDFDWAMDQEERLLWAYDRWFGGAYGVRGASGQGLGFNWANRLGGFKKLPAEAGEDPTILADGRAVYALQVFPAVDGFDLRRRISQFLQQPVRSFPVVVTDAVGPIADALVTARIGEQVYALGRTNADGRLEVTLPTMTEATLAVESFGLSAQVRSIAADEATEQRFKFERAGAVVVHITDQRGQPIPAKVEFRGAKAASPSEAPTPTPDFFPRSGEHRVRNLYYTQDGHFRQALPPGRYDVIVTHGPEYDAAFETIAIESGRETPLRVSLPRVVDTAGWISAEFANRSTVSRPFSVASQRGRVLNLLAEHIEFAPATERDHVSDFAPHLEALGATNHMATCPGIGLVHRTRKSYTDQNVFPVIHRPGAQDGGALQRPQHVMQVWWVGTWYAALSPKGHAQWSAPDKLIQVTPPGIWPKDGRSDGMYSLFHPRRYSQENVQSIGRFAELYFYDAMEVQPLDVFFNLPAFDPADPQAQQDLDAWWVELEKRRDRRWPVVERRNRDWPRMLNLGHRFTGVVNNNRYDNFHGSGDLRNWVKSSTDDPAAIDPMNVVHAVRAGHVVMSSGPFVETRILPRDNPEHHGAIPGDQIAIPGGQAMLHVRVQCPNWINADRVQVIFNGMRAKDLNFTRAEHSEMFTDGVVKFDQRIPIDLETDTHVMVLVGGGGPNLRERMNASHTTRPHVALTNPIWVDVEGDGYRPHSPLDDAVYSYLEQLTPLAAQPGATARVRLSMKNLGGLPARGSGQVSVLPSDAASIEGGSTIDYSLEPGQVITRELTITLRGGTMPEAVRLFMPRSSEGTGRRAVGLTIRVGASVPELSGGHAWWLPEHVPDRSPLWGPSRRAEAARKAAQLE